MMETRAAKRTKIMENLHSDRAMFEAIYICTLDSLDKYKTLPDEEVINYDEKGWQITIKKISKKEPEVIDGIQCVYSRIKQT